MKKTRAAMARPRVSPRGCTSTRRSAHGETRPRPSVAKAGAELYTVLTGELELGGRLTRAVWRWATLLWALLAL